MLAVFIITVLYGCAMTFTDADGSRHIIGLVNMRIKPCGGSDKVGGDSVSLENVGVSVYSSPATRGIAFGYNREDLMTLRNNSFVTSEHLRQCLQEKKGSDKSEQKEEDTRK